MARAARWAACAAVLAVLGAMPMAGSALAEEESEEQLPGLLSGARRGTPVSPAARSERAEPRGESEPEEPRGESEPEEPRGESEPEEPALVEGTPCTPDTVACVAIGERKAWLFDNGAIAHGPVEVSTGGPGKETPIGDHVVQWKNKNHKSSEYKTPDGQPSPMPWAVFFAEGGVAFHEGTLDRRSAGCVRLGPEDAQHFYTYLQLGDKVQVRP